MQVESWNTDRLLPTSLWPPAGLLSSEGPLGDNWTVPKLEPYT